MKHRTLKFALIGALALGGLVVASCTSPTTQAGSYRGYEIPNYTVLRSDGAIEIRNYPAQLVAEVTVSGNRDDAVGAGFRKLANYIFGGNAPKQKLAMTSPVVQSAAAREPRGESIAMTSPVVQQETSTANDGPKTQWTVQFGMPREHTLETLPTPEDRSIVLHMAPAKTVAAIRFSGRWTDAAFTKNNEELLAYLAAHGHTVNGNRMLAYYDDPFTFPWNRRNEILIPITAP